MCHIVSRLSTMVCGKIVIYMCFDIFFQALFFNFFTPVYRWFDFSSFFPLHNCIEVCPSLKSILNITIFFFVEKSLFLCVFIPNGVLYICVHFKESMKVSCYIIYFSHKLLILLTIFDFIVLYLSYIFNTNTWWERKMICGLIYSRRNRDVNKQRGCCIFSEFIWR